jgi:hypothetical protein
MTDQTQPDWYRKLKSPPADVIYAHKLGRGRLLPYQIEELVKAINPAYVAKKGSNTYLAHHQARAEMNRIFGYGNWDVQISDTEMIYETAEPSDKAKGGYYYRACYRGKSIVTVRDLWGMEVAHYEGVHAEANSNLPDRGEAHATALTSLESYALRRALINLGDRFGLGLYNGGSMNAHGQYTVQLEGGVLFDWADRNAEPTPADGVPLPVATVAVAPFAQPGHDTIAAEPVAGDDYVIAEEADAANTTSDGDSAPAAPTRAPRARAPKGATLPEKAAVHQQGFHEAQAVIQQANQDAREQVGPPQQGGYPVPPDPEAMRARLQAGFKVDEQGGAGGPANA